MLTNVIITNVLMLSVMYYIIYIIRVSCKFHVSRRRRHGMGYRLINFTSPVIEKDKTRLSNKKKSIWNDRNSYGAMHLCPWPSRIFAVCSEVAKLAKYTRVFAYCVKYDPSARSRM